MQGKNSLYANKATVFMEMSQSENGNYFWVLQFAR